jgi:predicted anti-sigma-YlaC factor YlaD
MSRDLTCRQVVELVSDYLDGALDDDLRADVEGHVGGCDGCAMVLDQLRETIRLTGTLTEDQLSPEQRDTLLAAFREHHSAPD